MNALKNGGPAFPTENEFQTGPSTYRYEGMTLRDYFAAKAMQAFIGQMGEQFTSMLVEDEPGFTERIKAACLASGAYDMADAMLEARTGGAS